MKKLFSFILILLALIGLVACGGSGGKNSEDNTDDNVINHVDGVQYDVEFWTTDSTGYQTTPYSVWRINYDCNEEAEVSAVFEGDKMILTISDTDVIPAVGSNSLRVWELKEDVLETVTYEYTFQVTDNKNGTVTAKRLEGFCYYYTYSGNSAEEYKQCTLDWELKSKEYDTSREPQQADEWERQYQIRVKRINGDRIEITEEHEMEDFTMELSVDASKKCLYLNKLDVKYPLHGNDFSAVFEHKNGILIKKTANVDYFPNSEDNEIQKETYYYDTEGKYCVKSVEDDYEYTYEYEFYPDGTLKKSVSGDYVIEYFEDGGSKETFYFEGELSLERIYDAHDNLILEHDPINDYYFKTEYRYDKYGNILYKVEFDKNGNKLKESEKKFFDTESIYYHDKLLLIYSAYWDNEGNLLDYHKNDYELHGNGKLKKHTSYYPSGSVKQVYNNNEDGNTTESYFYEEDGIIITKNVYTYISDIEYTVQSYTEHEDKIILKEECAYYQIPGIGMWITIAEKEYHLNGNLAHEVQRDKNNNKLMEAKYNEDGTVIMYEKHEEEYSSDKKELTKTIRDENNVIRSVKKGIRARVLDYSYNTDICYLPVSYVLYYSNGSIMESAEYYSDYKEEYKRYPEEVIQCLKKYSENGVLISEIKYYASGNKKTEITYRENGVLISEIEYYANGNTKTEITYHENGKEECRTEYNEQGGIVAVYMNGERIM